MKFVSSILLLVKLSAEYLVISTEREALSQMNSFHPHPFSFNYDTSAISYAHLIHLVLLTGTKYIDSK
jgi:hypothetical protein